MIEKIGSIAGAVWTALNENGAMNSKDQIGRAHV